jgi:hypothetical protein
MFLQLPEVEFLKHLKDARVVPIVSLVFPQKLIGDIESQLKKHIPQNVRKLGPAKIVKGFDSLTFPHGSIFSSAPEATATRAAELPKPTRAKSKNRTRNET